MIFPDWFATYTQKMKLDWYVNFYMTSSAQLLHQFHFLVDYFEIFQVIQLAYHLHLMIILSLLSQYLVYYFVLVGYLTF